jgi:hypothetical protein
MIHYGVRTNKRNHVEYLTQKYAIKMVRVLIETKKMHLLLKY